MKIYGRISDHLRALKDNRLSLQESNRQFVTIQASLDVWLFSLPSWMQISETQTFSSGRLTEKQPPHWTIAQYHMLYQTCIIRLQRTYLIPLTSDVSVRSLVAQTQCYDAAFAITRLASIFLRDNPTFHFVNPIISLSLFEAAIVWISIAKGAVDSTKIDPCKANLALLLQAIRNIGVYYAKSREYEKYLLELSASLMTVCIQKG